MDREKMTPVCNIPAFHAGALKGVNNYRNAFTNLS